MKPPIKIWVCNRLDGVTTFGTYVNDKRRVFCQCKDEEGFKQILSHIIWSCNQIEKRDYEFVGDPLPKGWL
jgi:hypothetical protein